MDESGDTLGQALASNLLIKERTRGGNNKLNPYNGKPQQEIRPESLTFLTKNAGKIIPRDVMGTTQKMIKELDELDTVQLKYHNDRSPQHKKHNTIQV